ncbi:uncharacterized protein Fot_50199 [Forsythia ovata]|uniref:Uncharacterized protein n=1 Tax=Forsythia ovata TaxID=205694 RepID=A0ABD1PZ15_9LAMI
MREEEAGHPPPVEETPPDESTPTQASAPEFTAIPRNFESLLNQKVEEAITRRKNKGRPISIKEEPFTEEVMAIPLPSKFYEPTYGFDGTTYLIVCFRLHGWPDAIACRAFPMTL